PKTLWSQRNNNNYQQTGLLTSLHYFAVNGRMFLHNFYLKSNRSILNAKTEGPSAYVLTADEPRPGAQADLLRVLQKQGVQISRATAAFTVTVPGKKTPPRPTTTNDGSGASGGSGGPGGAGGANAQEVQESSAKASAQQDSSAKPSYVSLPTTRIFSAGTYIVHMFNPYIINADSL